MAILCCVAQKAASAAQASYQKTEKTQMITVTSAADPWHFGVDLDPRIHALTKWIWIQIRIQMDPDPAIFVIDFLDDNKKQI